MSIVPDAPVGGNNSSTNQYRIRLGFDQEVSLITYDQLVEMASVPESIHIFLPTPRSMPQPDESQFLITLSHFEGQTNVLFVGQDNRPYPSILEAAVTFINNRDDPRQLSAAVQFCVLVAALFPDAIRPSCSRIIDQVRAQRINGYRINDLIREADRVCEHYCSLQQQSEDVVRIGDIWPDEPPCECLILPEGWVADDEGFAPTNSNANERFPCPIYPSKIIIDKDGNHRVEIRFRVAGAWQRSTVERGILASKRKITSLANYGVPVTEHNADQLIAFLHDFQVENSDNLTRVNSVASMGYVALDAEKGFMLGDRFIQTENRSLHYILDGTDVGELEMIAGFSVAGRTDNWLQMAQSLADYPRVFLAICASLAAPLFHILRAASFVFSLAGPTSGGKTTTLKVAASVWGDPDRLTHTWDTTRVANERTLNLYQNLPVIVDDTKQAKQPEEVAQSIYDVVGQHGRRRGSERGIRSTGRWHTIMLTSGESSITSFSTCAGTRPRTVELWNSPFGERSEERARYVDELHETISNNFGGVGEEWIRYILGQSASWDPWRTRYHELREQFKRRAGNNSVAQRMAGHFGLLDMTAELACTHFGLLVPMPSLCSQLYQELTDVVSEADEPLKALETVMNEIHGKRSFFISPESTTERPPREGWWGYWERTVNGGTIRAVVVPRVNDILSRANFEPDAIKRQWRDRGWTHCNSRKTTFKIRTQDSTASFVAFWVDRVEAALSAENG